MYEIKVENIVYEEMDYEKDVGSAAAFGSWVSCLTCLSPH